MRVLTTEGLQFVPDLTAEEASLVGRHWNAIRHYLETGAVRDLRQLEGTVVAGRRLETSLTQIEHHAICGDVEFESIYGDVQ
jgi:hypothetical protein